jgi:hypothetical protein
MSIFLSAKTHSRKNFIRFFATLLIMLLSVFFFTSCQKKIDYFDYVSELRSNIFIAKNDSFSLRIYAVVKESPYSTDGIPREKSSRMEAHLLTPEANKAVTITFQIAEQSYSGEMSYDNVKTEYFYSQTLDVANEQDLSVKITSKTETVTLNAKSVLSGSALSAKDAFSCLYKTEKTLFDELTDKYGFQGEIYIRLIYEDAPYYYVGVINRSGCTNAFLLNAYTGKILAKRQS